MKAKVEQKGALSALLCPGQLADVPAIQALLEDAKGDAQKLAVEEFR